MAECEVPVLSGTSKFEEKDLLVLSSNHDSVMNTRNENQTNVEDGDEDVNSIINTQNESEEKEHEQNVDVDWMNEFPPLVSRGIQVSSTVDQAPSTTSWVDALKKPNSKAIVKKLNIPHVKVNGDSSEGCSKVNLVDVKVNGSSEEYVASSEVCSIDEVGVDKAKQVFSVKIPRFEGEVIKEEIRVDDFQIGLIDDQVTSSRELVKMKRKEMDSHLSMITTVRNALPFDDMDCQTLNKELEKAEKQSNDEEGQCQMDKFMNNNNYIKSNAKSTVRRFGTLLGPGEKPEHVVQSTDKDNGLARKTNDIRRQEADLKEDVSIDKAEMGAELKAEKRDKKRLRMRERKKAAAAASDGFSLLTPNQKVNNEASTHHDLEQENKDETLEKLKQENEDETLKQENEDETLKKIETHQQVNEEDEMLKVQQQAELLELEAQLMREKKKKKKLSKKKKRKNAKAAAAAKDKNKMKWIFIIIFITLTLMLNVDLPQLLRQFLY